MIFWSLILLLASSSSPAMARNRSHNTAIGNDDHNIDDKQRLVYVRTNVKASKNMDFLYTDNDFLPENAEVSVNGYEQNWKRQQIDRIPIILT